MAEEIVELTEDVSGSPLYSEDLAPVPASKRTWSMWNLAFIWVGMAVCIPTYMLASLMIKDGLSWQSALILIGLANLVITLPMALNGHAGVKYGIPFPVLGRASFGINGIHLPSVVRAVIACGWFGVQTWLGGLAIYAIWNVLTGSTPSLEPDLGQFVCFGIFWFVNMFFVWKGTESIKVLEEYSAPILILMGIALIIWGAVQAGGFGLVLDQSKQLQNTTVEIRDGELKFHLLVDVDGRVKADAFQYETFDKAVKKPKMGEGEIGEWFYFPKNKAAFGYTDSGFAQALAAGDQIFVRFQHKVEDGVMVESSSLAVSRPSNEPEQAAWWTYVLWFTAMVGFWATMSLSIADITRYTHSQKAQVKGQFIGLPGTMILYSFVGIFVTCAAVINFKDVLIAEDAPWDPVSLLARFESPVVVVVAQIFMLIATLSTNIAANVIAPANAFSNLHPRKISFKTGGTITGIIGILIMPWELLDSISGILIFVSGLLGPVLGILLCDYYVVRKKELALAELYKPKGLYRFNQWGVNPAALIALLAGVGAAVVGMFVPEVYFLYKLSWFTGFAVAFGLYYILMPKQRPATA